MRVPAFAKINRSLRVLGLRPDGYHELRTEFQSIALHDTLVIDARRGPFRLTCDDLECPSDETNLVWRAAALAWKAARRRGEPRGVAIHLEKRIPMQSGLGGGSSDAAAALRGLGRIWRVDRTTQREIATSLGADVPYFLDGGTMLGEDRGDRLSRLPDARRVWVVLVIPSFGVSTKDAYGWWDADRPRPRGSNDLQAVVAKRLQKLNHEKRIAIGLAPDQRRERLDVRGVRSERVRQEAHQIRQLERTQCQPMHAGA